jgi:two-component system, NarL family, invasion response regulator UvrY
MNKNKTINVVIADDHTLFRAGIRHMLKNTAGINVMAEVESGEESVRLVRELHPHVILMDVKMPGIGGLEATLKILHFCPDVKVLIVSACTDNIRPARLLEIGVAGYLTKDTSVDELVQAIKCVNSGQRYISPRIAQQLVLRKIRDGDKSIFDELSDRELQITLMLIRGAKVGEIAQRLNLSPKTVNSYRYRIFEKLNVRGDVELMLLAIRHGLVDN